MSMSTTAAMTWNSPSAILTVRWILSAETISQR